MTKFGWKSTKLTELALTLMFRFEDVLFYGNGDYLSRSKKSVILTGRVFKIDRSAKYVAQLTVS